uniref:Uncharacterized protein n=1 Tax=Ursus maritimus TaxID=29073 RepID=A0A452UVQ2_URSMA
MAPLYHILVLCVGFLTMANAGEGIHGGGCLSPFSSLILSARTGEPDEEEGTFRSSIRRLSTRRR